MAPRSGQGDHKIIYRSKGEAKPVINGGVVLRHWHLDISTGIWKTKISEANLGNWTFRELFIDNQRVSRARHPNRGFLEMLEAGNDRRTNFLFSENDFPQPNLVENVELVFFHDWSVTRIGLKEIDFANRRITAIDSIGARSLAFFNLDNWEPHPRYFLENDLAFLDQDYEWYLDVDQHILFLKLPNGSLPDSLQIVAPFSENLINVQGTEKNPVRNLEFRNLDLKYCAFQIHDNRYAGIQACHYDRVSAKTEWEIISSAVDAQWAQNIVFENCHFSQLGGSGLHLGTGSKNCIINHCEFSDISGNAIMIGEGQDRLIEEVPWWKKAPEQIAWGNEVSNSKISKAGQQFYGAVGIWCGLTAGTKLVDNEIYDLPYTGISAGWMWSPEDTPCQGNQIIGNHIYTIMKMLSDGGGIYMLGKQPGSLISGNCIHDVDINAGRAESNGMFIDEGSTGITIEKNLIYHIAKSPLRFHRAGKNIVRENILISPDSIPAIRYNNTAEENIAQLDNQYLAEMDSLKLSDFLERWQKENIRSFD
ncbi:MAG: right-handed parallel beta-helix repeat-containing protein [Saprospiraceae bacterium]|nr:right-handed parallel beta-helix repeat-containing protein [Saprospiraceae bacterium]